LPIWERSGGKKEYTEQIVFTKIMKRSVCHGANIQGGKKSRPGQAHRGASSKGGMYPLSPL
jgi:hypothetical protein